MQKLNFFIEKDPRIQRIYDYAKEKYLKANMPQHNWEHILHDIGVCEDIYQNHAEKGVEIIKRDLPKIFA